MTTRYNFSARLPRMHYPPEQKPDEVIEPDVPVSSPEDGGAHQIVMSGSDECAWVYPKDALPPLRGMDYDPYAAR
jgi:hypothetical protein